MFFLTCAWRFLISNKLEQLEFKLAKVRKTLFQKWMDVRQLSFIRQSLHSYKLSNFVINCVAYFIYIFLKCVAFTVYSSKSKKCKNSMLLWLSLLCPANKHCCIVCPETLETFDEKNRCHFQKMPLSWRDPKRNSISFVS